MNETEVVVMEVDMESVVLDRERVKEMPTQTSL